MVADCKPLNNKVAVLLYSEQEEQKPTWEKGFQGALNGFNLHSLNSTFTASGCTSAANWIGLLKPTAKNKSMSIQ